MGLRLAWVVWLFALRLFAQPGALAPRSDAPPPPAEDRLAAVADDDGAAAADTDPSDLDDDDDDDDVALPSAIAADVPAAVTVRWSCAIVTLDDKHLADPLFRPPRCA